MPAIVKSSHTYIHTYISTFSLARHSVSTVTGPKNVQHKQTIILRSIRSSLLYIYMYNGWQLDK